MNALNRFIMLIIALLLVVVPVVLLLVAVGVAFGVLSASQINQLTNYQAILDSIGSFLNFEFGDTTRLIIAGVCALVALLALILLLRELSFTYRVARDYIAEDEPKKETLVKSGAVKQLVEHAARDAGAVSPNVSVVSVGSKSSAYDVACKIQIPEGGNFSELASGTRENIERSMERFNLSYNDVEVTAQGTSS